MYERRTVLKTIAQLPVAGLPLAMVLADPTLARAAADGTETVDITTASGERVSAALALPAATPAPAILLVHEWWGLNDHIKSVAAEFAAQGYVALAVDLYGGKVATTRDDAKTYMGQVADGAATATVAAWVDWLRGRDDVTGKIGTVGWCFGGGWSLNAALAWPIDAAVVYYGRVTKTPADLAALEGPVLGHFATRDNWINGDMVAGFETAMDAAGKTYTSHWYDADHAFANPTSARYDAADAALAWDRTLAFFAAHLN
jgi:carboxymethylenebutenolidase